MLFVGKTEPQFAGLPQTAARWPPPLVLNELYCDAQSKNWQDATRTLV